VSDAPEPTDKCLLWVVRHGDTEWSELRRHTGRTDIPLTDLGRRQAREAGERLDGRRFAAVFSSPLSRAAETARLAGFEAVEFEDDLLEWDYGEYEGRVTVDIRRDRPGWNVFHEGCPGGETAAEVGIRADRFIERVRRIEGDVIAFSHSHLLRVLCARWLGLGGSDGRLFTLETGGIGVLGYEREVPVIRHWNLTT
jgi:probable phosphoglycerate mutase